MFVSEYVQKVGVTSNGFDVFVVYSHRNDRYVVVKRKLGYKTFAKPFFSEIGAHHYARACVK